MSFMQFSPVKRWRGAVPVALSLLASVSFCQIGVTGAPPASQPAQASPKSSDLLHPALSQVSQAIVALNISRWKAPGEVRSATQQNVDSIQRDLNSTLPGLLSTADAAPDQVSAVFPVYRNIDALYDVLLRVLGTAMLAAPDNEASSVADALGKLESARADLANAILNASKNNETEVQKLKVAIQQAAATPPPPPPKTTVVNDGPAPTTTTRKKKKPAATPPPSSGSSQPQH